MKNAIGNVRKQRIKSCIFCLFMGFIPNGFIISMIIGANEFQIGYFIILGLLAGFTDYLLISNLIVAINPLKDDLFKKYGTPEEIEKILAEIENSKEYEDNHLIISKNYICDKKDYSQLVTCDDVLGIHKLVHKTNYVVDYFQIVITDKYGHESSYQYKVKEEEKLHSLMLLIAKKCKNAEVGYTKKERDNIANNKVSLPNVEYKKNEKNSEEYKCPDCNNTIQFGDKFCKECGCKLDWSDE